MTAPNANMSPRVLQKGELVGVQDHFMDVPAYADDPGCAARAPTTGGVAALVSALSTCGTIKIRIDNGDGTFTAGVIPVFIA